MTNKKYEFTGETIKRYRHTLHRIRALIDIPKYNVKKGNLGGFIEKEENLSHTGDCWVSGNASLFENVRVFGNALVSDNAQVFGNARVFGNAEVYEDASVFGNAMVSGNAQVYGSAKVFENAQVYRNAEVFGDAQICRNAEVFKNAKITKATDILVIGPIGSRNGDTTFYKSDNGIMVTCGCFHDTIEKFEKAVKETHENNIHATNYNIAIKLAKHSILNEER